MQQHLLLPIAVITACINAIPVFNVPIERCANRDRFIPLYRKEFVNIQSVPSAILFWSNPAAAGSFALLNIEVQTPSPDIEARIRLHQLISKWRDSNDSLYVVSGEVLKECFYKIGPDDSSIPQYFFRIDLTFSRMESTTDIQFVPQLRSNRGLQQFPVTIAAIKEIKTADLFKVFKETDSNIPEGMFLFYTWL